MGSTRVPELGFLSAHDVERIAHDRRLPPRRLPIHGRAQSSVTAATRRAHSSPTGPQRSRSPSKAAQEPLLWDSISRDHEVATAWLTEQVNGHSPVGLPWPSLMAFVRIATHLRIYAEPLSADQAWGQIDQWLAATPAWARLPTERYADRLGEMIRAHDVSGNLVPDAQLAALALDHGLEVCSVDSDFARFPEVRWRNPLLPDR